MRCFSSFKIINSAIYSLSVDFLKKPSPVGCVLFGCHLISILIKLSANLLPLHLFKPRLSNSSGFIKLLRSAAVNIRAMCQAQASSFYCFYFVRLFEGHATSIWSFHSTLVASGIVLFFLPKKYLSRRKVDSLYLP